MFPLGINITFLPVLSTTLSYTLSDYPQGIVCKANCVRCIYIFCDSDPANCIFNRPRQYEKVILKFNKIVMFQCYFFSVLCCLYTIYNMIVVVY